MDTAKPKKHWEAPRPSLSGKAAVIRKVVLRAQKACPRWPCSACVDRRCPAIVQAYWPDILSRA